MLDAASHWQFMRARTMTPQPLSASAWRERTIARCSCQRPQPTWLEIPELAFLWLLTVKPGCYGKEDLTLTRPNMEAMMTEQSEVLKQIKKKRSEVRAAASGAGDAVLKEWRRVAKHLFK